MRAMRRLRTIHFVAFLCVIGGGYYLFVRNPVQRNKAKTTACDLLEIGDPLDTSIVVNRFPFANIIIPPSDCEVAVYLVIYVHTSASHEQHRSTIRRTWGNVSQYNGRVRVVFVVGQPHGDEQLSTQYIGLLKNEGENYGDVLQSNFTDTYRNLTLKAVSGLKWVTQHCRSAKFVLKTDDDTFVNVYLLLRLLEMETARGHYGKNALVCNVCRTAVNRVGKWKTTVQECAIDEYPAFCQGIAFVMSMDVAVALYDASYYVPLLWMDDVYITGFLPALLSAETVKTVDAESFYMSTWNIYNTTSREVLTGPDVFRFLFFPEHDMTLYDVAWKRLYNIVQGTEFKDYVEALLSKEMQLKRKLLKKVPWKHRPWTYFFTDFIYSPFTA